MLLVLPKKQLTHLDTLVIARCHFPRKIPIFDGFTYKE